MSGRNRTDVWQDVPWIHQSLVAGPFTDFAWQHVRQVVAGRADRVGREHDLALALRDLLERTAAGHGSRREKTVAARARAGQDRGPVPGFLCGPKADPVPGRDVGAEDGPGPVAVVGGADDGPASEQAAGVVRVYDPVEESLRW
ncbi:hypothetical protein ACRJ4B_14720 [Streptomyces sp. GTA36]